MPLLLQMEDRKIVEIVAKNAEGEEKEEDKIETLNGKNVLSKSGEFLKQSKVERK